MQEGGKKVGVVYLNRELDENVLIAEVGLLEASQSSQLCSKNVEPYWDLLFGGELVLFVG